jgi:hypothetical protein
MMFGVETTAGIPSPANSTAWLMSVGMSSSPTSPILGRDFISEKSGNPAVRDCRCDSKLIS